MQQLLTKNNNPILLRYRELLLGVGCCRGGTVVMDDRPRAQVIYGNQTGWEKVIAFAVQEYLVNGYDVELMLLDNFDIDTPRNDLSLLILIVSVLPFGRQLSISVFAFVIVASYTGLFSRLDRITALQGPTSTGYGVFAVGDNSSPCSFPLAIVT